MLEPTNYNQARANLPPWTLAVHLPTVISSCSPSWQPLKWSVSFFNHAVRVHICLSLKARSSLHSVEMPGASLQALLGSEFCHGNGRCLLERALSLYFE